MIYYHYYYCSIYNGQGCQYSYSSVAVSDSLNIYKIKLNHCDF